MVFKSTRSFANSLLLLSLFQSASSFGAEVSLFKDTQRAVRQAEEIFRSARGKNCPVSLPSLIEDDLLKPPARPENITVSETYVLHDQGLALLKDLWKLRLKMRNQFQELSQKQSVDESCARDFQQTFEYIRRSEESLMMWLVKNDSLEKKLTSVFMAPFPYTLENAPFDKSFQVGDIFLIRGDSWISSFIGGMGGVGTSFTHAAIIAEDNGSKVVVETVFPSGTEVTSLQRWLEDRQGRVVQYRFRDTAVAKLAAQAILKKIQVYSEEHHRNIPYNFSFAPNRSEVSWYCAEMISWAFSAVTEGKTKIPLYVGSIAPLQRNDLFKSFGVQSQKVFLPTDIEIDPRFELIQEFRYVGALSAIQQHDAVMQILLEKLSNNSGEDRIPWLVMTQATLLKLKSIVLFDKDDPAFYISIRGLAAGLLMRTEVMAWDEKVKSELITNAKDNFSYGQIIRFLKDRNDSEAHGLSVAKPSEL